MAKRRHDRASHRYHGLPWSAVAEAFAAFERGDPVNETVRSTIDGAIEDALTEYLFGLLSPDEASRRMSLVVEARVVEVDHEARQLTAAASWPDGLEILFGVVVR